ncbi:MAG: YfhO family protein [Ruminococcus sp.]|nr:YfhO family protein [Ruminococcus sp.]
MTRPSKKQMIDFSKVAVPYVIVFVISFIIGLIMYHAKEIAPFGENSVLCMDLWGQYFPMYVQNATSDSIGDMFYSWNGAFGYNNWAQNAYYCNSIFLLLFKILPVGKLVSALNWICLLKISLSSVTCLGLLKFRIKEKNPILMAGAVSYGLCAYMLAFYSQCMWTDSLIYLPLIMIGLEKMLYGKKPLLYTLMLALTIISSFYIGFAICIFLVLYFISLAVPMISVYKNENGKIRVGGFKLLGMSILKFAVFSILAGAISAMVILPVGKAIGNTIASGLEAPHSIIWYADITQYLQCLLPKTPLYVEYKCANIFTTILVFIMTPLYLFNGSIKISERITNALIVVFLFASLNCNVLNYIWHGFHFPNQLPARWSFMLSLVLVYMCCAGVSHIKKLHPFGAWLGLVGGFLTFLYVKKGHGEQPAVEVATKYTALLVISAILIFGASLCAYIARKTENKSSQEKTDKKSPEKIISVMNAVALCCISIVSCIQVYDSGSNFVKVATLEQGGLSVSNGVSYSDNVVKHVTNAKEWKSGNDDFYRCIANSGYTFNPSMLGDFHGMGYYSSTMQGSVFKFLRFLGNRVYAENVSTVYNSSSPIQNGLFGVKYALDYNHNFGYATPNCKITYESEVMNIWENPTVLSIAYATSDKILDWHVTDEVRAVQNHNELLNAICGEEINAFSKMDCTKFSYENLSLMENKNWNENFYITKDMSKPAVMHYSYNIEQNGYYYMEHNFRAGSFTITWGDNTKEINVAGEKYIYLGEISEGTEVNITASAENISIGCCGLNMYRYDNDAWQRAYDKISAHQLDITKFKSNKITGNINMAEKGLVMTTIPQDNGWSVYCDGDKLDTTIVADTFIAFEVPSGNHEITMKYRVPALSAGVAITLFGLVITLLLSFPELYSKYLPKRKKKTDVTEEDTENSDSGDEKEISEEEKSEN